MGTVIDPAPQLCALFAQFVLYVDFFFLIAGPGQIDAAQYALFNVALPLHLIEEIFGEVRVAEEQPVFTWRFVSGALLHKGAERRNTGARTNHDHRGFRVGGQAEVVVVLDKDPHLALFFHAIRKEARRAAGAGAPFDVVTHDAHGDVDFVLHLGLRRGDRVEARRQRTQQVD